MEVELEEIVKRRDYVMSPQFGKKCLCGGKLWLYRNNGTMYERCIHTDCGLIYEIIRICSFCKWWSVFDTLECRTCEPIIKEIAENELIIEESIKSLKKLRKNLNKKLISHDDYNLFIGESQESIRKCENRLRELRDIRANAKHFTTQINKL